MDVKISIFAMDGKSVQVLYNDYVKSGPQRVSFNINSLAVGNYLVIFENNGNKIFSEKLIKN